MVLVAVRKQRISNGQDAISVGHRTVGFPSIHSANANRKLFVGRQILPPSTGRDQSEGIQRSDLVSSPASISVSRISPIQRSDMWCTVVCVSFASFCVLCVSCLYSCGILVLLREQELCGLVFFASSCLQSHDAGKLFNISLFFCYFRWFFFFGGGLLTRVRKHFWTCLAWSSDLLWWWRTHCKSLIVSV